MKAVRIGGVPEHFNTPWHWGRGKEIFADASLEVDWVSFPGGTGAMNKALRANEIDIALVLTEGAVADIANGNPSKIIKFYVDSPLLWGIHVPAHSDIESVEQLKELPFAISRNGSGSHLMAAIMAHDLGWRPLDFLTVGNLEGARKALANEQAYGFMWEKFTTQPYVNSGEFRRVGEVPTPWSCFAMVATEKFLRDSSDLLPALFESINRSCTELYAHEDRVDIIANHANLSSEGISTWLQDVRWTTHDQVDITTIERVIEKLKENGVLESERNIEAKKMIWSI